MTSLAPRSRRLALSAWLVALLLMLPEPARAASPDTVVLGSDQEAVSVTGIWMRRIYAEAFRRLGIPIEFAVYPTKRLSTTLDEGGIDGEFVRVHAYAAAHPNLVRVEEPVFSACAREAGLRAEPRWQAKFPPSELATVSLNYFTAA